MNESDKKAFEAAFEIYDQGSLANYDHVKYGFQAALELRDSQVGEPKAWGNLSEDFADSERVLITNDVDAKKYHEQVYDLTPLFTTPPTAQINQQLVDALKPFAEFDLRGGNLGDRDDNQPVYARDKTVLTVGDFKRAQAALTAAKSGEAK